MSSSQKRKHADSDAPAEAQDPEEIHRSAPLEDRSSIFIGYFSPTLNHKDLQSLAEFRDASHKILGWRKASNQQTINKATQYVTGSDDDGEKYAGKRVEKALAAEGVEGAVVVARWWGGVLLGPVRFEHIERVVREAVAAWRESGVKRRKIEEEALEKGGLVRMLGERDHSILVLRGLAAAKEARLKRIRDGLEDDEEDRREGSTVEVEASAGKAKVDYKDLPLDRLRLLDKARDATLTFLLKRIDAAETELAKLNKEETAEPP